MFLFTYWEDEIRPRLAKAKEANESDIKSDIMGDLRILRNVILHSKGIMRKEKFRSLKKTQDMFPVDQPITISYEEMHQIFVFIKQDCMRLMFDWLGVDNPPFDPETIKDMGIQFKK